jgi:hypothetical protein
MIIIAVNWMARFQYHQKTTSNRNLLHRKFFGIVDFRELLEEVDMEDIHQIIHRPLEC